jgi:hypothetical protein
MVQIGQALRRTPENRDRVLIVFHGTSWRPQRPGVPVVPGTL